MIQAGSTVAAGNERQRPRDLSAADVPNDSLIVDPRNERDRQRLRLSPEGRESASAARRQQVKEVNFDQRPAGSFRMP
jgi:hypothetical protein